MERRLLLLGLLHREDMHGYKLYEFIERDLATCTDLKKSTAYYLLNQMAEEGLIAEEMDTSGSRPARRVYSLTAEGEAEFERLLRRNLRVHFPSVFPGDIGLAFLDHLDPAEARRLLSGRKTSLIQALREARNTPIHGGSLQWVIEHQIHYLEAELAFLDHVLSGLPAEPAAAEDAFIQEKE